MILITGPTGSGKTTTLYGLLHQVQSETKNMVTIEDPVEYHVFGTTQVGINEAIGLTFSSVLRNVLRQDPDVIMVGEIRDRDTADIATRAALTGHFVLSTLHTNNTVATITRLLDIGLEPYLVVAAVTGIMAQRLVRRICKNCIAPVDPPDIIDDLKFAKINNFFRGRGCSECKYTGYKGRIGVYEMLMLNLELKKKIIQGVSEEDLLAAAREFGFETMFEDACAKVDAGYTTFEEILTKVPYEYST
jgi:type IV pilus assembly protein PilB